MPKDLTAPSQQWNIQDQVNQSKPINQERVKSLNDYKSQTEAYKNIDSILSDYESQGLDTSIYRKKLESKANGLELGFGEKLGVVGREVGNDYVSSFSKAFGGNLDKSYSQKMDDAQFKREQAINPVSTIASEVALDPLTYTPLNFASKGTAGIRAAKDFAKGSALSGGLYTAKEYGNDNFKPEDAALAGVFGGGINAGIGKFLSRGVKGDLLNPDVTNAYNITDRILSEGGTPYTKDAKLSEYIKSKLPTEKIVEDSSPIVNETFQQNTIKSDGNNTPDSVAKKINDIYFGGKNIIEDTQPVRSDMPVIDNQQASKVNDFFNPVDKNRIQAQGDGSLPTPASQQDPFIYQPKQADTFGWEKDAQRNNEIQQLREKIAPLNDTLKTNETNSLMGVKRENPNDISLPPMGTQKQLLPDVLPLDNREEMKSIIRYAKDNNAVDEFISKLPPNKRVDEVQKFFDNLKPAQSNQDGIVQVRTNIKEPAKTYDSNALNEFEGLTKATGMNTADVLSLEKPTSTAGVRNSIIRYEQGKATQRDFEILDAVDNFMKYEGDNFRSKVNQPRYKPNTTIDDAVSNNMDYETANRMGAIPFSNGSQTFGGAAVSGTESEFNQRDYNNDGKHDYKDNLIGALIGAVGVKAARKIMPNAFKDKNIDGNTAGMFVGAKPNEQGAFSDVATKKVMKEIDDSKVKYKSIPSKEVEIDNTYYKQNYGKLGDIIDHPELFKQYPELKNTIVAIADKQNSGGSYNDYIDHIELGKGNVGASTNGSLKEIRKKILDLDKNPIDSEYAELNKLLATDIPYEEASSILKKLDATPTQKEIDRLSKELTSTISNLKISGEDAILNDTGKSTLLHEVQHAIQNKEGWARGGNPKQFDKTQLDIKKGEYSSFILDEVKSSNRKIEEVIKEIKDDALNANIEDSFYKADDIEVILQLSKSNNPDKLLKEWYQRYITPDDSFNKYQSLHGEQQARATQQRMNYTPEQRTKEDWTQTLAKNEGKYNEPIIKYDSGVAMSINKDTKDLMIQHNLSQDNLRYANSKGGIAAPSLATVKKDMPIDGFGDITLIGDKALATPSKDMKAFASDIYSPRHPRERREYNQSDIRKIDNSLIDYIHKTGGGDVSTSNDVAELMNNVALKAKFLEEQKGISLKIPNRVNPQEQTLKQFYKLEYTASVSNKGLDYQTLARDPNFQAKVAKELQAKYIDNEKVLNTMLQPDRLFNLAKDRAMNLDQIGRSQNKPDLYKARELVNKHMSKHQDEFDNYVKNIQESYSYKSSFNNNGKQQPYTEQNVMKYLTSNLRGGENFNYGAGSIRATVTPEFKTIEQIKKAKERLVTSKEFESIKSTIDNELGDIISKIADDGIGNSFTAREIASEFISDYAKRGKRALSDYSVKVKPEDFAEIDNFLNKLKEMPTEYFESKFLGKMELNKFKLAIIPKNASKETKEILEKNGIKYKTYDPKMPESRIEVIKREAEKNNVLFASPTISGGMVGGITGANNDLNGDGKTNITDILIGVGLGAGGTKGALIAKNTNIAAKATSIIKNLADTETADKIFGHKIYQKTDYMNLREEMISGKNKQYENFALLHEQLKLLDDATRTKMYDYMSGNKTIQLDPNIKQLADNYTGEINRMGKELVDLGVLEEAQFDKFKDRYLHRRYEKDFSQKFNSLFTKGKTIQGVHARGNEWNGTKTEYEKLLKNGEIGDFFAGKIEATKMQNGQYKFRQDWTEEQRTRWGEVKDIAFSLPETLMRTREMIDHATMLKKIVDNTNYVSDDPIDGYVHLAGKRYGALNGKYVPADVASDIKEFNNALFGTEGSLLSSKGMEAFKALSTFWKKSHTVYNPIAHLNNLLSNVTMQFGAGINPNKAVVNATKGALASQKVNQFRELTAKQIIGLSQEENATLRALAQDEDLKLWNQAQQAGLFGRSNLNDILNRYINPNNTPTSTNKFKNGLQKVDEFASSAYQGEDNIMRFSMLKSLTEAGTSFDDAIKQINSTIPDYTKPMSQWARFGRDSMLTPFISWTYYATPIILKQMKERPERIVAIYGALYGMNQMFGIDPFNEKDIPQQNFSMKRIPIYKDGNEVTTIKVDRWIPHGDILSPLDFVKNLTSGGAWAGGQDVLRNRNSYFGGKITNNEGALKAYDLTKYAVEQITPDALDNVYNLAESKIMSKEKRTKNPVMQPRTTAQELLKMVGINAMTYNKANQAREVEKQKLNKLKKDKGD